MEIQNFLGISEDRKDPSNNIISTLDQVVNFLNEQVQDDEVQDDEMLMDDEEVQVVNEQEEPLEAEEDVSYYLLVTVAKSGKR
jgi:hypothetical protein